MAAPPLIVVLNGPNLNLLGQREPEIYGRDTLADLEARLHARAGELGVALETRQSNHEGQLIDWLHDADARGARAILFNPGGYSHTSVALHDAVRAIAAPVIVVHLSDPATREPFRQRDLVALAAHDVVKGKGGAGYLLALDAGARL